MSRPTQFLWLIQPVRKHRFGGGRAITFYYPLLMHLLRFATPLIEWFLG